MLSSSVSSSLVCKYFIFFFKQKTAYEMRISDWSSDVCSSDLTKQLRKALDDMAEEGVTQVFYPEIGANWVIGVVGQLQLDVLLSRLEAEYKVAAGLEMAPFETARWVSADDPADLKAFTDLNRAEIGRAHV